MQVIPLLCFFVAVSLANWNEFVTDFGDVVAGESFELTWTNKSAGYDETPSRQPETRINTPYQTSLDLAHAKC